MARSKSSSESLPSASSPTEKAPVVPNEQAAPNPEVVANGNEKDVEAAPPAPPPNFLGNIPDGGLQAWLQVAAGWSLFFNTWGENHVVGASVNKLINSGIQEFSTLLVYPLLANH